MIGLSNPTLQKFITRLIDKIKEENEYYKTKIDIPFVISSLYQSFKTHPEKFTEFIKDLKEYPIYNIDIETDGKYTVETATVCFIEKYSLHHDEYEDTMTNFCYVINFYLEDRPFGYCQCTPDMPDYREDKHCCGHGCDATFCGFTLTKTREVTFGTWDGDEHDYWDFEDEFYMSDAELKAQKEREEREEEIRRLKAAIDENSKKLEDLMKENDAK